MKPRDCNTAVKKYVHLTERDRYQIEGLLKGKKDVEEIAAILGRDRSTIYREIKRGAIFRVQNDFCEGYEYRANSAIEYLQKQIYGSIRYFALPRKFWSIAKTTNRLERLFEELKRRVRVFRRFPNTLSCERWLYALLKLNHKVPLEDDFAL